jgi:hypothetical protein
MLEFLIIKAGVEKIAQNSCMEPDFDIQPENIISIY